MISYEKAAQKYGELLNQNEAVKRLGTSPERLYQIIEEGYLDRALLVVGQDVARRPMSTSSRYFIGNELDAFNARYKMSLTDAAKAIGISFSTLKKYHSKGRISPLPGASKLWDIFDLRETAYRLQLEARAKKQEKKAPYFEMLTDEQCEVIESYISHRSKGLPIKFKGLKTHTGFSNDNRAEQVKGRLAIMVYKIVCGRCGISDFAALEKGRRIRSLTPDEQALFNPSVFDMKDLRTSDLDFVHEGLSGLTYWADSTILRSFLIWFLKFQQSKPEHDRFENPDGYTKFMAVQERIEMVLDDLPTGQPESEVSRENDKVFMTREQILLGYSDIMQNKIHVHFPLQVAVVWMIGCLLGLRPTMEWTNLRIEHFHLDQHGFLKVDEYGYGILNFPKRLSKGGKSGSINGITLVVPRLVRLINKYLEHLYEKYPEGRGKGWFVRPIVHLPEEKYSGSSGTLSRLIHRLRRFDWCPDNFITYDTRHSIHNLIYKGLVQDPPLVRYQTRVAQIQMRHAKTGSVGEMYYTEEPTLDIYRQILDDTLSFPWDIDELTLWEEEKGYRKPQDITPIPTEPLPEAVESAQEKLSDEEQKQLKEARAELATIRKKCPKGWTTVAWTRRMKDLKTTISALERRMNA